MKARYLVPVLGFVVLASGCNMNEIPLVGLDDNGNPTQVIIGKKDYSKNLGLAVNAVQDSAIPAVSRRSQSQPWLLRTIVLGLGVNTEIGIGAYKVGALPKFRVALSNSTDPTLP
ncbi:MAG: hypothetical protein HY075_10360 [Deltaproteobacteria bacterium]|nr:hypothetical protein [Deltaproteobacteria bacterium]